MRKFDLAKKKYSELEASAELKNRVMLSLKAKKSKKYVFYKTIGAAACFVAVMTAVLNIFPGIAYSMQGIPVIGTAARIFTFREYKYEEKGFHAQVDVPKIEGLLDKELEDKLNREFAENANAVILAFERDVKELKAEFGDENVHIGVTSSYQIKTDNDKILALDVYIVNEVGSSSTKHTFYNIDKTTGELLSLEKLFGKKTDYVTPISEYIKKEMVRRNNEENAMFWIEGEDNSFPPFEKIDKNHDFYINDKGNVVICFDKYEVAPGAWGCPEFEIPKEITDNI